ncbi:unnamed protein product [Blepharisma stoltei]|uniref:Uncharacterized protein n=1 Tax=Blepharisma stoltei TaxID=1481888 RepID=A0AAU9JF53_9CILI|nr:unnamed protein product [Blepharisma stoltei]
MASHRNNQLATPGYSTPSREYAESRGHPRRRKFEDSNSPLRIRPFEDCEDVFSFNKEVAARLEMQRKAEREREMKQEILQKIKALDQETWLFNIPGACFCPRYSNL